VFEPVQNRSWVNLRHGRPARHGCPVQAGKPRSLCRHGRRRPTIHEFACHERRILNPFLTSSPPRRHGIVAKKGRYRELSADKLVDGRPAPTMTIGRTRLAGRNRTVVAGAPTMTVERRGHPDTSPLPLSPLIQTCSGTTGKRFLSSPAQIAMQMTDRGSASTAPARDSR
jgi:hypothetical protein